MVLIKDKNIVYLSGGRICYDRTCGVLHHEGSLENRDNPVDGPGPVVGQLALHPRLVGQGGRQPRREGPNLKAETRHHHAETIVVWRACLSGENLRRQERESPRGDMRENARTLPVNLVSLVIAFLLFRPNK
jgi:hypothetical protein